MSRGQGNGFVSFPAKGRAIEEPSIFERIAVTVHQSGVAACPPRMTLMLLKRERGANTAFAVYCSGNITVSSVLAHLKSYK
jgi:hypothetical protein